MGDQAKQFILNMRRPRMGRRVAALCLSIAALGLGVAVFDLIGLGTDPCASMNLGISRVTGWSFGSIQLGLNALLMLFVIRRGAGHIGLGTVLNMVCIGYIAEFFMALFARVPALANLTMLARLALFVPMMALFLLAASFYTVVDMGVAPYDAVPLILAAGQKRRSFRTIRMCWDVGALVVGYVLGATIGLATLVTGFCLGPAIAAVSARVSPWFE